jgi:hypothetical protein
MTHERKDEKGGQEGRRGEGMKQAGKKKGWGKDETSGQERRRGEV